MITRSFYRYFQVKLLTRLNLKNVWLLQRLKMMLYRYTLLCIVLSMPVNAKSMPEYELIGFDCGEKSIHMIEWLGLGENYKTFVSNTIQDELYKQQPKSTIKQLTCTAEPILLTKALTQQSTDTAAMLTELSVTFLVDALVELNEETWLISIKQNYTIKNMHLSNDRVLLKSFDIQSAIKN